MYSNINHLISLIAFGSLLMATIYHSNLYLHNRTEILKTYSIYLWFCIIFLGIDLFIFKGNLQEINSIDLLSNNLFLLFIIRSVALWISFNFYLKLLLNASDKESINSKKAITIAKNFWVLIPFYIAWHFPIFFVNQEKFYIFNIIGLIFNLFSLIIAIYFLVIIINNFQKNKSKPENNYLIYIIAGGSSLLFFNVFTILITYFKVNILSLNYLSFICLGNFVEIFFFSIGVSLKMKTETIQKITALNIVNKLLWTKVHSL